MFRRIVAGLIACLAGITLAAAAEAPDGRLRYDEEYPVIGYGGTATRNAIARLQQRLDTRTLRLDYRAPRGYLDSMLRALEIDPSSQILVYSKTSLQAPRISGARPRAIYFNEHTYVAWVQDSTIIEIATMDAKMGAVFYLLDNEEGSLALARENNRCLVCHDAFSMTRGGVPQFIANSLRVDSGGQPLPNEIATRVSDETPVEERWGGWYVTGRPAQNHLGNIQAHDAVTYLRMEKRHRADRDSLRDLLNTEPYVTDKSDVVALMVMEHQLHVQNLITRANFKARTLLARDPAVGADRDLPYVELPEVPRERIARLVEPLVEALLLVNEAPLTGRTTGSSGFDAWFQQQGPRDARGRSLRELDLASRLFRYPVSFLIYSEALDALPLAVRQRVYTRLADILEGRDQSAKFAKLGAADRKAAGEILVATRPEYAAARR